MKSIQRTAAGIAPAATVRAEGLLARRNMLMSRMSKSSAMTLHFLEIRALSAHAKANNFSNTKKPAHTYFHGSCRRPIATTAKPYCDTLQGDRSQACAWRFLLNGTITVHNKHNCATPHRTKDSGGPLCLIRLGRVRLNFSACASGCALRSILW